MLRYPPIKINDFIPNITEHLFIVHLDAYYLSKITKTYTIYIYLHSMAISPVKSKEILFFTLTFAVGFIAMTMPYFGMDFGSLPGDLGDTRFNIYILEHAKQYIDGNVENGYWNANFMYPEPEVISLSDNLLGSAPFYIVLRWLGLDIFSSFQWWLVILTFLNFGSAYLLFRYIFKNRNGALLGAFIFAFSVSLASQMNHAQVVPRFAIPLTILFLLRWVHNQKNIDFGMAVTLLVYQFYCGIYLGFMAVIPFAVILVAGIIYQFRPIISAIIRVKNIAFYLVVIAVNGLLIYKLFAPYMRRAQILEQIGEIIDFPGHIFYTLPSPLSYLSASPSAMIHGWLSKTTIHYPAYWDHWIFPGWISLLSFIVISLLLTGSFFSRSRFLKWSYTQQVFVLAGVVCCLVFLRFDGFSLYYYLQKVPGYTAMRSLTRIININLLFFGGAFALVIHMLSKRFPKHQLLIFLLGFTLLFIDNFNKPSQLFTIEKAHMRERHQKLVDKMQHLEAGTIISYEPKELNGNSIDYQIDAMLAAQELNLKSINGYSARAAHMFYMYWDAPNKENLEFWISRFDDLHLEDITVIH
jgi:hypothetical protein